MKIPKKTFDQNGSVCIVLPMWWCRKVGLRAGDLVEIDFREGKEKSLEVQA